MIRDLINRLRGAAHVDPLVHAARLRESGIFHAMGDHCAISPRAIITDPAYVSLGSNVRLSDCALFGHDGSVNMINRALGTRFDAVGPIEIGDDVFIGHGAIILPNSRIGARTIIAAGAVVSGEIAGNCVAGGVPARVIRSMGEHIARLANRNAAYPWRDLIEARQADYDPAIEPELVRRRVAHFFGGEA